MDTGKYELILRHVANTPWAIAPDRLQAIVDVLAFQAGGGKLSADEIQAAIGTNPQAAARPRAAVSSGVAVIGLRGIISHRIEQVQHISGPGGTSVEGFGNRLRHALDDPRAGSIVIDVDSPGGSVDGVPELARMIRESRGKKPIVAVANTGAASAAYWLATQADEFSITESGSVGSIGVFLAHEDLSAAMAAKGVKMTFVSAGPFKTEGNPFEPLGKEAREHLQARVNSVYNAFIGAVAAGRGVSEKTVLDRFGGGRSFDASEALERGMVDRIETLDQAIARLSSRSAPRKGAKAFEFMK